MFRPDPKPEPKAKKVPKRIKPLSDKRRIQNDVYLKLRKMYLDTHSLCDVRLIGCTHYATEIHHAEGRTGSLLTDITHFVAICRNCHILVEKNNL